MPVQVQRVHKNHPGRLKIVTGSTTEPEQTRTVYEMGEPDADGWRDIKRGNEQPRRGRIRGTVSQDSTSLQWRGGFNLNTGKVDEDLPAYLTEHTSEIVVHDEDVQVGETMGTEWTHLPDKTLMSRPVISIELL